MLPEDVVNLGLKLGANDVVCEIIDTTTRQVKFVNNVIVVNKLWKEEVMNIFLSWRKRVISSSIQSNVDVKKFLKKMLKAAKLSKPKEDYYGIAEGPFKYRQIEDSYDKKIEKLNGKEVELTREAIEASLKNADRCSGVLYTNCWKTELASSNSVKAKDKGTSISLSIRSFTEDSSGHSVSVSRKLSKFEPRKAGEESSRLAKESRKPKKGKAGRYDVILHPLVMANLLDYMSYGFSAFEVDAGTSFLIDKLGKKVANKIVTIEDDGRMKNGFGARKFDEEGRPTQRTKIIENGILKNYLHNTSTAKKFKVKPTANAGIIYPQPWNLILKNGNSNLEEMISEVKDGLYVTNTWYTRFSNYRTGDFSTIPRDAIFRIKNGEIVGAVRGIRISDNMLRILKNIVEISKERKQIYWWEVNVPVLTGYVLVNNVNVTSSVK